jgi:hypothetical protein
VAGPLIVTAEFSDADFAWLDGLRRAHFPPDRNQVPAHLTLFHALPPFAEGEVRTRLRELTRRAAPKARIEGVMSLGGGVAFRIASPDLDRVREELRSGMHGLLTAQDSLGWRPHVTIQNKVAPKVARALLDSLESRFTPRPLEIAALALQRYLGGAWQPLQRYPFRP